MGTLYMTRLCLQMHQIASHCIFISKNFRGGMPPDLQEACGLRPLTTTPPNEKSKIEPWMEGKTGDRERKTGKVKNGGRAGDDSVYFVFKHNYYTNMAAMTYIIRVPQDWVKTLYFLSDMIRDRTFEIHLRRGGYSLIIAIGVCAVQRGRIFGTPIRKTGYNIQGVF